MKPQRLVQSIVDEDDGMAHTITGWLAIQRYNAFEEGDTALVASIDKLLEKYNQNQQPTEVCRNKSSTNESAELVSPWKNYKLMIVIWIAMVGLAVLALRLGIDKLMIASGVLLVGLISQAFAWMVGIVALVPFFGPLIIKVLSIPAIWLLNSIGYFVSIVAIKRGYSKDVLTYRGITIAMIIGIVIGYIVAKLVN